MRVAVGPLVLAWVCCCSLVHVSFEKQQQEIYLLCLLPYHNPDPFFNPSFDQGQNIQPALELARDQINNSSILLKNYTLNLVFAEDGCDILTISTVSFVTETFATKGRGQLIGTLGPACSASAISLASITNRTDVGMVMVHGAGSAMLADRTKYPYLLGTLGTTDGFVQALLYILRRAAWKRVGILYDDSRDFYQHTKRGLLAELHDTEVELLLPVSPNLITLEAFEQSHLRIAFMLCPVTLSRKIICLSYNRSLTYSSYQWVLMGHQLEDLQQAVEFVLDGTEYRCSTQDMAMALEMSILLTYSLKTANDHSMLAFNTSYKEYRRYYDEYRDLYNIKDARAMASNSTYTFWASYLYDTVWAWAFVLDNLTRSHKEFDINTKYGNLQQSKMIVDQFYRTKFEGVSGEISFDKATGYTDRAVDIMQVRNGVQQRIGTNKSGVVQDEEEPIFIKDDFPTSVRENRVLCGCAAGVILIQIVVIVALHILTIIQRKKPSIKASSQKLLHISYIGTYMVGLGSFCYYLFLAGQFPIETRSYFCQLLWGWCLPIGFILTMVPVAMRTWRVYRIFKHYRNPGPLISDPVLISTTLVLLLPVLVISIAWNTTDPFRVEKIFGGRTFSGAPQVKQECNCTYYYLWLGIIFTYITAILLLLAIFSLLTRNIQNRSFATTSLRVFTYIMTASFLLGFPLFYFLNIVSFDPNYSTAVFAVHINFMMAAFITCVFVPPFFPTIQNLRQKVRKVSKASVNSATLFISP
jgi:hypothetical protein